MTIQGAIADLKNMLNDETFPVYYKPSLKKVIETVEQESMAFKVACELLNGSILYGYDADRIFEEVMEKDGVVCSTDYENFIHEHLDRLTGEGK